MIQHNPSTSGKTLQRNFPGSKAIYFEKGYSKNFHSKRLFSWNPCHSWSTIIAMRQISVVPMQPHVAKPTWGSCNEQREHLIIVFCENLKAAETHLIFFSSVTPKSTSIIIFNYSYMLISLLPSNLLSTWHKRLLQSFISTTKGSTCTAPLQLHSREGASLASVFSAQCLKLCGEKANSFQGILQVDSQQHSSLFSISDSYRNLFTAKVKKLSSEAFAVCN